MAGSDQNPLLALIRDFSTEKFQGERRIESQKKRIEELISEMDASNKDLEESKRDKETTEQELKGYEVELSMNETSVQSLEARIALTNNGISELGSEMAALKSEENSKRDEFIAKMLELNAQIRKTQEFVPSTFIANNCSEESSNFGSLAVQDAQQAKVDLKNKIAKINLHTNQEEEQYKAEQVIHHQVQEELANLEKKALLLESVMKENMELQQLSSKQMSEMEEKCAVLVDELQKRFLCPRCHQDNSEELGQILQISDGS